MLPPKFGAGPWYVLGCISDCQRPFFARAWVYLSSRLRATNALRKGTLCTNALRIMANVILLYQDDFILFSPTL